ncbi:lung seven transmembrane receptor-domain-containing protein [Hysterangium stoloniferum]|nr:lung seven transmembrane receptor-domain-containing protein [Hysterangium stoloniferum]
MLCSLALLAFTALVTAFEVQISDVDWERQVCSGMWGGENAHINVSFEAHSEGQVAMVIYEWQDVPYLGKASSQTDESIPRTYVCTSAALSNGLCDTSLLGHFIFDLPMEKSFNDTSFWSARVGLRPNGTLASKSSTMTPEKQDDDAGLWFNPEGNPTPPASEYDTPWRVARQRGRSTILQRQDSSDDNSSPTSTLWYVSPIKYEVRKTGYYCIAIVPLTVDALPQRQTNNEPHPAYEGTILFQNTFKGKLPASDYPKVNFYLVMFVIYCGLGGFWASMCYRHKTELLPIQFYISGLVGFLVMENLASLAYYRYLNAHGPGKAATAFLFVVAILDAGRNALSFFLLLIVSLGLSVVRESLGKAMLRCRILTIAHFIFGVLYAVGIVELQLESTSALILLLFVIPLALTLSGFMMWIMYALNGTIAELNARKQHYKLSMFKRLYYILIGTTTCILLFFVVSSLQFSNRLAEDYAAKSWRTRWWLLDGFLVLLYLVIGFFLQFSLPQFIYFLMFTLAMSEELAQDENDAAEDYEFDALQSRMEGSDEEVNIGRAHGVHHDPVGADSVVFEIGDQDSDAEDEHRKASGTVRPSGEDERTGLMNGGRKND